MGKLPVDLTEEILSTLPVKTVARFRCVSRSWNSLLFNNPELAELRFKSAPQQPQIGTQKLLISTPCTLNSLVLESFPSDYDDNQTTLDFPFKRPNFPVNIVGSCNGLVCVAPDIDNDIFLWNPSTGAYRKVPNPEIPHDRESHCYGFGYDSVSDDYKIVIMTEQYRPHRPDGDNFTSTQVFSSKANSWKSLQNPTYRSRKVAMGMPRNYMGLFFRGALHWLDSLGQNIYAFDVPTEKFYTVPLPGDDIAMNSSFVDLAVVKGCLCLTRSDAPLVHITGLVLMEEYRVGTSWVLLDGILLYRYAFSVYANRQKLVCVNQKGAHVIVADGRELVFYNPEGDTRRCTTACEHGHEFTAIPYVENLTSPYVGTGC